MLIQRCVMTLNPTPITGTLTRNRGTPTMIRCQRILLCSFQPLNSQTRMYVVPRLFAPKHAGAPLITPTRIFVAPKTEAPVDAVIMMGICLLVEFMMAPIDAEEPPQLRAFWSEVGVCCRV